MKKRFVPNDNNLAICYYRFSSSAQNEASIDQQKEAAHRYADNKGYTIVREYDDPAISGTTDKRPGLQLMLSEVKRLKPAVLIMWKMDRLAREQAVFAVAKTILREAGTRIEYVADISVDDSPGGRLIEHVWEAMAEFYSDNLSENINRGMRYNAEKALFNGHKIFGYTVGPDRHYVEDPATAPIVPRIFNDYASGKQLKTIADELNSQGIKTVKGNDFTIENLRKILHNDRYLGMYRYGDIEVPDGMPQLVTQAVFDKVQARFAKNKQLKGHNVTGVDANEADAPRYWLTGKLFCAKCGDPMHGMYGTGKGHGRYYYYACNSQRKGHCKKKPVKKDLVESNVIALLRFLLNTEDNTLVLIENAIKRYESVTKNTAYLDALYAEFKDTEKRLANIVKAIEDGIYTASTRERLEELERRKEALDQAIMVEEANIELFKDAGFSDLYRKYLNADLSNPEIRDEVLDYFVDKIYLDDDGKLSFVLKLYDKDGVTFHKVTEAEIIANSGFTVFDTFVNGSTKTGSLEIYGFQGFSLFTGLRGKRGISTFAGICVFDCYGIDCCHIAQMKANHPYCRPRVTEKEG